MMGGGEDEEKVHRSDMMSVYVHDCVCVCVSQVVVWMMSSRESVDLKQTWKVPCLQTTSKDHVGPAHTHVGPIISLSLFYII